MKKKYEKPGMYVENFSLSQSIAAGGCGAAQNPTLGKPSSADIHTCGWDVGGIITWINTPACNDLADENDPYAGVCYNNPNGYPTIFSLS